MLFSSVCTDLVLRLFEVLEHSQLMTPKGRKQLENGMVGSQAATILHLIYSSLSVLVQELSL